MATARTIAGVSFDGSANIALDTADITEDASALYFTNARARSALSVSGSLAYNSGTGVISFTQRTNAEVQALITAGTGVTVSSGQVSIGQAVATTSSPTFANMTLGGTDSIKISSGTTAQRNGTPAAGMFRYNTTTSEFEGYTDEWGAIGGGGGSFTTDIFAGDGADTTFTVSSSVSNENNLMVFIDGVFQAQNSYSVSGTTLTFSTAPANSRVITVYHAKAVSIGTPSDNSVNTVQLVDDSVTSAKLDTNIAVAGTLTVGGTGTFTGLVDAAIIDGANFKVTGSHEGNLRFESKLASGVGGVAGIVSSADATAITIGSDESVTFANVGTFGGTVTALSNFNSTTGNDLRLNAGSANRDIFMQVNDTTHMTVQGSTGRVGIGTTAPATDLHIHSTDQNALTVETDTAINQIHLSNNTNSPSYITQDSYCTGI